LQTLTIFLTLIISSLFVMSPAFAQIEEYVPMPSPSIDPDFIIINPSDDSFIVYDSLDPENLKGIKALNFGDNKVLKLANNLTNNTDEKIVGTPIIKFDLDEISSEEIDKAYLLLYVTSSILVGDSIDIQLHLSGNNWSENNISGLNSPQFNIQPISTITIPDPLGKWISFDVSDLTKQNSGSEISFVLTFTNYDAQPKVLEFASKELDPNFSPKILIKKIQTNATNDTPHTFEIDEILSKLQEQNLAVFSGSTVLTPIDDSYIGYDVADPQDLQNLRKLNFGDKEFLKLWYAFHTSNYTENEILSNAFLKFNLSDISSQDINSAKLRMFASGVDLAFDDIGVGIHAAESNWSESSLNGTNFPTFSVEPIDIVMINASNRWYEWDVTEEVKSNVGSPLSLFVIFSEITNGTEETVVFASKENPNLDLRPSLIINPAFSLDENEADLEDSLFQTAYSLMIILGAVVVGIVVIFYIKKKKQKLEIH